MSNTSDRTEHTAYEDTIYFLEGRLALATARVNEAHDAWLLSGGAPGTLDAWTAAITKQVTLDNTLHNLRDIDAALFGTAVK